MSANDTYFENRTELKKAVPVKCILSTSNILPYIKEADSLQKVLLDMIKRIKKLEG